ncbi:MAG: shikimate dehydrogenase [Actinobacteria bacterium]|uniref:shikimate dehydrogenase (NADP(+)) n=1 Tax=freshwater metagenome TaxID=449393 RepID=A0A6J7E8R3_9ZZZZ|nr:shikimate dehydrogenase [Actinomycetota bacterium]
MAHNFMSTLTASFAMPAAENPTVAVMDAVFAHHGMNARYLNCEIQPRSLGDAVRGALAMGFAGFNCSLPHKVAVVEYLDELAPSAAIIGAVNCVVITDGRLIGENTDGKGFVESLRTVADPGGQRLTIFGAGGAARAIAIESALAGAASITIVNTTESRGRELVALINEHTPAAADFVLWDHRYAVPATTNIVINATSIGLFPDIEARLNIEPATLLSSMVVADVIPNPPRTLLLQDAAANGCTTLDGMGMLVNQGRVAIKLWTGVDVDGRIMRQTLESLFA